MRLDKLANHEGNAGARRYDEVDALAKELSRLTQEEVSLSTSKVRHSLL